jgi:hypothetical protein
LLRCFRVSLEMHLRKTQRSLKSIARCGRPDPMRDLSPIIPELGHCDMHLGPQTKDLGIRHKSYPAPGSGISGREDFWPVCSSSCLPSSPMIGHGGKAGRALGIDCQQSHKSCAGRYRDGGASLDHALAGSRSKCSEAELRSRNKGVPVISRLCACRSAFRHGDNLCLPRTTA